MTARADVMDKIERTFWCESDFICFECKLETRCFYLSESELSYDLFCEDSEVIIYSEGE